MAATPSNLSHRLAPYLVVALGLTLTAFIAWRAKIMTEQREALQFQNTTSQMTHAIAARVDLYVSLLRGASGVLCNPVRYTADDFRQYVEALRLEENYRGIQGIGFVAKVNYEPSPQFLPSAAGADGADGAEILVWPDRDEGIGFAVTLIEPADNRNGRSLGFDMFSEPVRRAAMERAWQTGAPSATGRVTLVQDASEERQAGFLIYLPVFASDPDDAGELLGFVYSPFRADDLFSGIFGPVTETFMVEVYDGPTTIRERRLHVSGIGAVEPAQWLEQPLDVAGRRWTIRYADNFVSSRGPIVALGVAAVGLVLTVLLSLLFRNLAVGRESSERHAAALRESEQAARDNERLKQAILDSALDGIITVDDRGLIVEYNPAAERLFGYDRDEAVGQALVELILPPQSIDLAREELERAFVTGSGPLLGRRVEVTARRSSGELFPIEVAISRVDQRGRPFFTAYLRDISSRRRAETQLAQFQAKLERRVQQRTAELEDANQQLESFSYSVSHDLRAPARHVLGFAQLLQRHLGNYEDAAVQRLVGVITDSAKRMAKLIDDLLEFSRTSRQELRRSRISSHELVAEVRRVLSPEMTDREIEWEIEPLPDVEGDRGLLTQVWTNLLSNAIKYTRRRAQATIRITADETPGEVVFSIADNGTGFDMTYANKLFGVFQRLHREEDFEGTGIGLANVARIIQRHGGRVWAEGQPDVGATFHFSLPRRGPVSRRPALATAGRGAEMGD
jgi:PAS domain S-box-containing protein